MKKIGLFLLVLVLSLFALACNRNKEIDWDSKVISNVEVVKETFEKEYEYDEFELGMLLLHVTYTDGLSRDIGVSADMLSEKDLNKLHSTGSPRITIEYDAFVLVEIVKLIDSGAIDNKLNPDGLYDCVVKAVRNKDEGLVYFIIEPNANVVSLTFSYTYDQTKMQLSDFKLNNNLEGVGNAKIEDGRITFSYSQSKTALTESVTLFTVKYEGDFRYSSLGIDTNYKNVIYVLDSETYMTSPLSDSKVLYHASIK